MADENPTIHPKDENPVGLNDFEDATSTQPDSEPSQSPTCDGSVDQDDGLQIWWNIERTTKKPCLCCSELCTGWAFLIILLIILMSTIASIEFSLDVPFYDRSEINQGRRDAYLATIDQADFLSSFAFGESEGLCVHDDPTVITRNGTLVQGPEPLVSCQRSSSNDLRLLYVSKDRTSNILTPKNLQEIKKIEDRILDTLGLTRYCYLIDSAFPPFTSRDRQTVNDTLTASVGAEAQYVACERINSALNFMDPDFFDISGRESGFGYYLMAQDQYPQEYDLSAENLDRVVDYWSAYTRRSYNLSTSAFLVASIGDKITVDNLFLRVTSSDFVPGETQAVGLVSSYSLGYAIHDYLSATEDLKDQVRDTGKWLWETFDAFLKEADFEGVDVYFSDSKDGMRIAEEGYLAEQSIALFPVSVLLVLMYLIVMQDSFFIGVAGITQIILAFVPTLLLYRYVVPEDYIGVLNIISFYIILGIGVDDIFVSTDQFLLAGEKEIDLTRRMQLSYRTAAKAMFTTSATTFISFISNATSVFPAVATFGIFSALLVLNNFLAVIIYFPTVYSVYRKYIHRRWWDHPSLLFCCKKQVPAECDKACESAGESRLTLFFKERWAPLIMKLRYFIVVFFMAVFVVALVFTMKLEPEEDAPTTIPADNNYRKFGDILLDYFGRVDNPTAIRVHMVSGINPDNPIDRSGTDDTDTTDFGTPNFVGCDVFNPTTPQAQVWSLLTCHDMFFGNVTEYHGDRTDMGLDGRIGPTSRRILDETVTPDQFNYYSKVSCVAQGFRDWLLTDNGCTVLKRHGLDCYNETSTRSDCIRWDTEGNSCEPYPVPEAVNIPIFRSFLTDPATDPSTLQTNFDKYASQVYVDTVVDDEDVIVLDDFSCRTDGDLTMLALTNAIGTTVQAFAINYENGLELFEKWDDWAAQMRKFAPREMIGTMQSAQGAWAFYHLNKTLLQETFRGIALSLGLSFLVLTLVGGNIFLSLYSVLTIMLIVLNVFAFTVLAGYRLGVIEAVLFVVVIGMSIDYSVHVHSILL